MNLLLLKPEELDRERCFHLDPRDRRSRHLREVLRVGRGSQLRAGILGGTLGEAKIESTSENDVRGQFTDLHLLPPAKQPIRLAVALPRPKVLRRLLMNLTALGVSEICLFHAARVEKSYWQSPWLKPDAIESWLHMGLEQARDTCPPKVTLHSRFRLFVEDLASTWKSDGPVFYGAALAAPSAIAPSESGVSCLIGPEGGFVPFETDLLQQQGFTPFSLGPRILTVETAAVVMATRLTRGP